MACLLDCDRMLAGSCSHAATGPKCLQDPTPSCDPPGYLYYKPVMRHPSRNLHQMPSPTPSLARYFLYM